MRARSVIAAASATTNTRFTALYGQEFSTISSGNHMNVFGIDQVLTTPNGDFRALIDALAAMRANGAPPPVVQLNHPDVQGDLFYAGSDQARKRKMFDDYGVDANDLGPHFRDWAAAVDEYVNLVEVLSGPAKNAGEYTSYHYGSTGERDYFVYLTQGLHAGPSAGQDNHHTNWGTTTPARTGVYARSRSAADIYQAFRERRTFVTEDKNLSVKLWANNGFMGDRITTTANQPVQIRCEVSDADEPNARYTITLISGAVDPQRANEVPNLRPSDGQLEVLSDVAQGTHSFQPLLLDANEAFFYVRVQQRDDDRALSAPVWVSLAATPPVADTGTEARFCWSARSSSHVYHQTNCSSVAMIKAENLQCGPAPPAGWNLHSACPPVDEDDGH